MAAVQEFTVDTTGGAGDDGERKQVLRTQLKLVSEIDGLTLAARILRMLKDKLEVTDSYKNMTDEELLAKAALYHIPAFDQEFSCSEIELSYARPLPSRSEGVIRCIGDRGKEMPLSRVNP